MTHSPPRARLGFTIAELLVALVLAALGLLALVGADTSAWRHHLRADRALRGALLAHARVQSLTSAACATTTDTRTHPGDVVERWSSTRAGPLLLATASASWPSPHGRDSVQLKGSRWCER